MFFIKRKKKKANKKEFLSLSYGLSRTRGNLLGGLVKLFGKKKIDDELLQTLESKLITSDVGVNLTRSIIKGLIEHTDRKKLSDTASLLENLKDELNDILLPVESPLVINESTKPYVILVLGVNGAGKTTTIAKLARLLQNQGKKVMLAAGDTFRAAAIEQLQVWGEQHSVPVVAQSQGSSASAVVYDAMQSATAKKVDVLIVDTAGRLHTQNNLMEELKKVKSTLKKLDETAPHEIMLVLDAGTGQNALMQARQFNEALGITGLVITKFDGTAKGGVIFSIAKEIKKPIRFVGVGEKSEDLREFKALEFVSALFSDS